MLRSKRNKTDKKKAQKIHAKRRALQRYSIELNKSLHKDWIHQIQNGVAKFVERQSNRISVYEILVEGKIIPVVYDKIRKNIVTVLPPDYKEYAALKQDSLNF